MTTLAVWSGGTTIPFPNLRVGPWNQVVLAYLLATVPSFGWLAIARVRRTPLEVVSTVSVRLRLLDQLCTLVPPALAGFVAVLVRGPAAAGVGRNLLFIAAASLAVMHLRGWLAATLALLSYLVASALAGFTPGRGQPDPWAFILGASDPLWTGIATATAVASSWLLIPAAGDVALGWRIAQVRELLATRLRHRRRRSVRHRSGKHAGARTRGWSLAPTAQSKLSRSGTSK